MTEAVSTSGTSDTIFTLIVPDNLVNGLEPSEEVLNLNFIGSNKDEIKKQLTDKFNDSMFNQDNLNRYTISI